MTNGLDDFLGAYRAPRMTVRITTRADLLAEHAELHRAHQHAIRGELSGSLADGADAPAEIVQRIRDIEQAIADSEVEFTVESIGRHRWLRLLAQNPPRKLDREQRLDFNGETFPPALLAATIVKVGDNEEPVTVEQAEALVEALSEGQFTKLFNAALTVNMGDDSAPKSVMRSATADAPAMSSTTASPEGSLAQSS